MYEYSSVNVKFSLSWQAKKSKVNFRKLYDENREAYDLLSLQEYFNNPVVIRAPGVFESLVRGIATQSSQKIDRHYAED
ncbi:hypothetical protein NQ315_008873, partial [Exocentrus adspersus]